MVTETEGGVLDQASGEGWHLYHGDSAEVLKQLPESSVGLVVTSIPFGSLYVYSPSERDLGNVQSFEQFWEHMAFITAPLLRVLKPGRLAAVHVQNPNTFMSRDGVIGRRDFRGECIRHFVEQGFVYHSEVTIDKDPQAVAIRNHPMGMLFVQLARDQAWMWQANADYLCLFRKPGENQEAVRTGVTTEEWIRWARPVWPANGDRTEYSPDQIWPDIRATDVLPVDEARDSEDERHLCPLQLGVIERAARLWSNPGDVLLDPFNGVGSTGCGALKLGRRYVGIELKGSYYRQSARFLQEAERQAHEPNLFDGLEEASGNAREGSERGG